MRKEAHDLIQMVIFLATIRFKVQTVGSTVARCDASVHMQLHSP